MPLDAVQALEARIWAQQFVLGRVLVTVLASRPDAAEVIEGWRARTAADVDLFLGKVIMPPENAAAVRKAADDFWRALAQAIEAGQKGSAG